MLLSKYIGASSKGFAYVIIGFFYVFPNVTFTWDTHSYTSSSVKGGNAIFSS